MPSLSSGCQWPGGNTEPAADLEAAIDMGPATPLDDALSLLSAQLDTASAGLDEAGTRSLGRVEAISDRLLETRLPFAWLNTESYSLEARLRQIQSRADRIEALRTGGARREDVLAVVVALRDEVALLRAELRAGGKAAPTPVGRLLDSLDRSDRRRGGG